MGGCSTKAAMPDEPAEPAAPVPEAIVALGVGARVASATNDQRQALEIWETREAGRVLVVDGAVRLSEADERPYHEMLSHVAVCAAAARKRRRGLVPGLDVLVVGGCGAGVARELVKHAPSVVKSIAVVDVDGVASNFVATHLPALDAAKMRAELRGRLRSVDSGDAASWFAEAARARRRFDVVILDADAGNPLDAKEIDVAVKAVLSDGGVAARSARGDLLDRAAARAACDVFEDVRVFSWLMPTLKGGHCKAVLLGREPFDARDESNWDCELAGVAYFDGASTGPAAFALPPDARGALRAMEPRLKLSPPKMAPPPPPAVAEPVELAAAPPPPLEGWRPDAGARFGGGDVRGAPGLVADAAAGFEDRHREARATPEKAPKRRPSSDPKIRDAQAALLEDENFLLRSPEAAVPARPADGADFSIFACTALGADALCKTDDFYATVAVQAEHFDDDGGEAEDDFVAMMRKLSGNHETKAAREKPSTRAAPEPAFAGPVCAAPGCALPAAHLCSRCRTASYCSAECQIAAWPDHRASCVPCPGESKDDDEGVGVEEYKSGY